MTTIIKMFVRTVVAAGLMLFAGCSSNSSRAIPASLAFPAAAQPSGVTRNAESVKNPSFEVVHWFSGISGGNFPQGGLVYAQGKLFGTTGAGGLHGCGTVFSLTPNGDYTKYTETVLYHFAGGPDACNPSGGLIVVDSKLYGTTQGGGTSNAGTVFTLPLAGGADSILYSFTGKADGSAPFASLLNVGDNLYGTTYFGGPTNRGVVFRVPLSGGSETVLHAFVKPDGTNPQTPVINVGSYLYGTTTANCSDGNGSIYRVPLAGGTLSVLESFGKIGFASGLINVGSNLYGTTFEGGGPTSHYGSVFRISLSGGPQTVLYAFKGYPDGYLPFAPVTLIGGALYGTTTSGGSSNYGIVFRLSLDGKSESVLHSFSGVDGKDADAALISAYGNIYGTAASTTRSHVGGNVFKL